MRLSLSVVFSALAGYLLGAIEVDFYTLTLLAFGGYFMLALLMHLIKLQKKIWMR